MMMPVMDGRTFRLAQRDDPTLSNIPVVVLTAHASGERAARELQVNGFLRKPVDLQTLLDVVGRYCERDKPSPLRAEPPPPRYRLSHGERQRYHRER
jgi:CheY-like chemotaxis protein